MSIQRRLQNLKRTCYRVSCVSRCERALLRLWGRGTTAHRRRVKANNSYILVALFCAFLLLHAVYHLDTHFFNRIPCHTYMYLRGEQTIEREAFVYTQPTTNATIQALYADDPRIYIPSELRDPTSGSGTHALLPRTFTKAQHHRYWDLLKLVMFVFDANNVTYCMEAGTLLGSYFFHDVIPWDDDIDLLVDLEDYPKVKQLYSSGAFGDFIDVRGQYDPIDEFVGARLNTTASDFNMYGKNYHKHKIFFRDEPEIPCYTWRWPFIDIVFFTGNDTHIWDYDSFLASPRSYVARNDYLPFHRRPFGGVWVPAPRNPLAYLRAKFDKFTCSFTHCHSDINPECEDTQVQVPCGALKTVYPHVVRTEGQEPNTTVETLQLGKRTLYSVVVQETYQGQTEPMVL